MKHLKFITLALLIAGCNLKTSKRKVHKYEVTTYKSNVDDDVDMEFVYILFYDNTPYGYYSSQQTTTNYVFSRIPSGYNIPDEKMQIAKEEMQENEIEVDEDLESQLEAEEAQTSEGDETGESDAGESDAGESDAGGGDAGGGDAGGGDGGGDGGGE